jgi:hypothetical protein
MLSIFFSSSWLGTVLDVLLVSKKLSIFYKGIYGTKRLLLVSLSEENIYYSFINYSSSWSSLISSVLTLTVTMNVLPSPSYDSADMFPSILSHSLLQIVNPKPTLWVLVLLLPFDEPKILNNEDKFC